MTTLRQTSPQDSIVTTWWSPGHFISGMAKQSGRFIIVLNLDQVLSMEEMVAMGQSMTGAGAAVESEAVA